MRYITTDGENITFVDVNGKTTIVPMNSVYAHFYQDTVSFVLISRTDKEGFCIMTSKAADLEINGTTYTYQQLLDGEGISDLYSPVGVKFEVVDELPEVGQDGIIYLVENQSGSYTEYIWLDEQQTYEELGDISQIDLSNYYTKSEVDTLLEEVKANKPFPEDWLDAQDMQDLIDAINDDEEAVVGSVWLDTITLTDLPAEMVQAEVKAEVISEIENLGKVIVFTVTSSEVSPYHWEYTSAYGEEGVWREWATAQELAALTTVVGTKANASDVYTKAQADNKFLTKAEFDPKEQAIAEALTDLNTNKADVTDIPVVPTNVSAFTNDAGYLTQHQSLDEYYTKTQIDAQFNTVNQVTSEGLTQLRNDIVDNERTVAEALNDLELNKADLLDLPTDVSELNNDAGYLTIDDVSGKLDKSEFDVKERVIAEALTENHNLIGDMDEFIFNQGQTTATNTIEAVNEVAQWVGMNFQANSVDVYLDDGTNHLYGANGSDFENQWQLTNLDLTPYRYIKCFFKAANLAANNADATPTMIVTLPLEADAMSSHSSNQYYWGSNASLCCANNNKIYAISCIVDSTKTKFQIVEQVSIYGTVAVGRNGDGRYLYKIIGYYS